MHKQRVTLVRRGEYEVREAGRRWHGWMDPYHLILKMDWSRFFLLMAGGFLAMNLLFATAYWLVPDSVEHARPGSFFDLLFFSIETMATVGYGEMVPGSLPGHVISSVEILVGMMSLAIVTGLVFARFSKPTARVLFSDKVVTREFDGHRVLMMRLANARYNRMLEPTASMGLVRLEQVAEGEAYYRIYDLPLQRKRNPVFELTWTLVHRIDETSPLYGWDHAALEAARAQLTVSVSGHDETIAASVYALQEYSAEQIYFDHRFVSIVSESDGGRRIVDLTHFHDVVPCTAADKCA